MASLITIGVMNCIPGCWQLRTHSRNEFEPKPVATSLWYTAVIVDLIGVVGGVVFTILAYLQVVNLPLVLPLTTAGVCLGGGGLTLLFAFFVHKAPQER